VARGPAASTLIWFRRDLRAADLRAADLRFTAWSGGQTGDHLVDGDLAPNNHGWQRAAGPGADAAPAVPVSR
jgi:deoxyribodipyrimidine photolyase